LRALAPRLLRARDSDEIATLIAGVQAAS
jgi:hypothetical protein